MTRDEYKSLIVSKEIGIAAMDAHLEWIKNKEGKAS